MRMYISSKRLSQNSLMIFYSQFVAHNSSCKQMLRHTWKRCKFVLFYQYHTVARYCRTLALSFVQFHSSGKKMREWSSIIFNNTIRSVKSWRWRAKNERKNSLIDNNMMCEEESRWRKMIYRNLYIRCLIYHPHVIEENIHCVFRNSQHQVFAIIFIISFTIIRYFEAWSKQHKRDLFTIY